MPDKMDTRLPYFEGQRDFVTFVRFLDNQPEFQRYLKVLDERVAKFMKAAEVYGKAQDIGRLHAEAETTALRAQGAFEKREKELVAGEEALVKATSEKHAELNKREDEIRALLSSGKGAVKVREEDVKAREDKVSGIEAAAAKAEEAAQKRSEAAVVAKKRVDAVLQRMKVAVSSEGENAANG